MSALTIQEIDTHFPFLKTASEDVRQQAITHVMVQSFPAGTSIFWEGDTCAQLAVVLSGTVRVYKIGENGRELTLYRIQRNESCILTATCILSNAEFPAFAVVEDDVRAALIPAAVLRTWVERYDSWRSYVFSLMSQRLASVIATVEEVAFRRVDVRIAELLAQRSKAEDTLSITHQEIASELGTAREVVSRILKDFERENIIGLSRGTITVYTREALLEKAAIA